MRAWIYLFIAAIFEVAWIYTVKFMQLRKLLNLGIVAFFENWQNFSLILPVLGYVIFGIGNIYFFSKAMKILPAAISYAVWMGIALVGVQLIDVSVFKTPISYPQIFFLVLILIGVIGLKIFA